MSKRSDEWTIACLEVPTLGGVFDRAPVPERRDATRKLNLKAERSYQFIIF